MTDDERIEAESQAIFSELLKGKKVINGQTYYHYEAVGAAIGKIMEIEDARMRGIRQTLAEIELPEFK